jgi:hypothetical protein
MYKSIQVNRNLYEKEEFLFRASAREWVATARAFPAATPLSDWREFDTGHIISAGGGGFALLSDECNVNGECQYDNAFNQNNLWLDTRYGIGTAD